MGIKYLTHVQANAPGSSQLCQASCVHFTFWIAAVWHTSHNFDWDEFLRLCSFTIGVSVASCFCRRDELVIDARPQQHGGMLIMQLVLMDAGGYWGKMGSSDRPRWLRSILATNRHHARWGEWNG